MAAASRGNNPKAWQKFLDTLDERLQFGLLSHIQNSSSYHFEAETLYIEFENEADIEYLSKDSMKQQLQILAKDIVGAEKVVVRKPPTAAAT